MKYEHTNTPLHYLGELATHIIDIDVALQRFVKKAQHLDDGTLERIMDRVNKMQDHIGGIQQWFRHLLAINEEMHTPLHKRDHECKRDHE